MTVILRSLTSNTSRAKRWTCDWIILLQLYLCMYWNILGKDKYYGLKSMWTVFNSKFRLCITVTDSLAKTETRFSILVSEQLIGVPFDSLAVGIEYAVRLTESVMWLKK